MFLSRFTPARPLTALPMGVREAGSWAERPTDAEEGEYLFISGGVSIGFVARWSDAWGDYVPFEAYGAGLVVDATITGSRLPSAETPAWTHTVSGGSITQSAGFVQFDGDEASTAYVTVAHGLTDANHLLSGRVGVFSSPLSGVETGIWEVYTSTTHYKLAMANASGFPTFLDDDTQVGTRQSIDLTQESGFWLFVAFLTNELLAWAPDLSALPIAAVARNLIGQPAGGLKNYGLGDHSTVSGVTPLTIQTFQAGHYT